MRAFHLILLSFTSLFAEEPPQPSSAPQVEDLGKGKYRFGLISFDENTRRISFPGEVNMSEGLLEYAIVTEQGKIHESLLSTKASPLRLNIALKLLRYQNSPELFEILTETFASTGQYPEVSEERKTAARLQILVSWKADDGKEKEVSLNDLIYHTVTESEMEPVPWIYHGSSLQEGRFQAETTGDLAAIYITRSSLLNFSGKDRLSDEPWIPNRKKVPPVGTPVTITFAPLLEKS